MSDKQPVPGPVWWIKCIAHNCIIHPLMPLADALRYAGATRFPNALYWLHDNVLPYGGG